MNRFADAETQKQLIDACNVLCKHAADKLPEWWDIELVICAGEASFNLCAPNGESVDAEWDAEISAIDALCVTAIERELEQGERNDRDSK